MMLLRSADMLPMKLARSLLGRLCAVTCVMTATLVLLFYPWASDLPLTPQQRAEQQRYYDKEIPETGGPAPTEGDWHEVITARVSSFVRQNDLENKKVLEVGSGRGFLQDLVQDYTGLDISASAKRLYHKPFIVGSATAMPLPDDTFDSVWTIFVFEHVDNPEAGFNEIRRVARDGALLFIAPAWDVSPWAASGYPVRPYADLGWSGKIVKASIPFHAYFWNLSKPPTRLTRYLSWRSSGQPTRIHYRRLAANYSHYWMADADAINSLDRYEVALWFLSRGDECLNCDGRLDGLMAENDALLIRVHKPAPVTALWPTELSPQWE